MAEELIVPLTGQKMSEALVKVDALGSEAIATQSDLDALALSSGNLTEAQIATLSDLDSLESTAEEIDTTVEKISTSFLSDNNYSNFDTDTIGFTDNYTHNMTIENRPGNVFSTDTKYSSTRTGSLLEASVKMSGVKAEQELYFFGVREITEGEFTIVWIGEKQYVTEETVVWKPSYGNIPEILEGDFIGVSSNISGGVGISTLKNSTTELSSFYWYPNAIVPFSVGDVITSDTPSWYAEGSGHTYTIPLIKFVVGEAVKNIDSSLSNTSEGYARVESGGKISNRILPDAISSKLASIDDDLEYVFDIDKNETIATYKKDSSLKTFKYFNEEELPTSGTEYGHERLMIPFDTATNYITEDGFLTRIRLYKGGAIVSGYEGIAKIQIFIVKPKQDISTVIENEYVEFELTEKVGEILAEPINKYREIKNLNIPVSKGDLIAFRGIGCGLPIGGGGLDYPTQYMPTLVIDDLTMEALDNKNIFRTTGGDASGVVGAEFDTISNNFLTSDDNLPILNKDRKINLRNTPYKDSRWIGKNVLVNGTSITVYIPTDDNGDDIQNYISRTAENLGFTLLQQGLGSSHVAFSGSDYGLSQTIAEIQTISGDYTFGGGSSYEYRMLGAEIYDTRTETVEYFTRYDVPDVVIFDHGHNDMNYPLGDIDDATDRGTYYGAVNFVLEKLREHNPDVRIIFTTPFSLYSGSTSPDYDENPKLVVIRDANIALAKKYKAPIVDFSYMNGMDKFTHPLHHDGTDGWGAHPQTELSHTRASDVLTNFLLGV